MALADLQLESGRAPLVHPLQAIDLGIPVRYGARVDRIESVSQADAEEMARRLAAMTSPTSSPWCAS